MLGQMDGRAPGIEGAHSEGVRQNGARCEGVRRGVDDPATGPTESSTCRRCTAGASATRASATRASATRASAAKTARLYRVTGVLASNARAAAGRAKIRTSISSLLSTCAGRRGVPFAEGGEGPRCQRRHRSLPVIPEDAEALLDMHSSEHVARRCKRHRILGVSDSRALTPELFRRPVCNA